jgi:branched-chain amino acid transport system substrate-binding protein
VKTRKQDPPEPLRHLAGHMVGARGPRRLAALTLIVLAGVVLGACGSNGGSASKATASTPVHSNPAKGSSVVVGLVNPEGGDASFPEFREGAQAAIEYVNNEVGGLDGHRISVQMCRSDGTPQQAIRCANDLVRAHPVAVIAGEDRSADSAFPIYQRAGVPYVSPWPVTNQQFVSPVAVSLNPGIAGVLAALAQYIHGTLHGKSAVTATEQGLPKAIADQFIGKPLNAAGVSSDYVYYSTDNPDLTATFAAVAQRKPDVLIADFDNNQQCVPAMNAARQVGATFKVIQIRCNDDSVFKAAGSIANGELFYSYLDSAFGVQSADFAVFRHVMETYSPSKSMGIQAAAAASSVLTLKRVLDRLHPAQLDAPAVLRAFNGSAGLRMFMGAPLTCGVVKVYPRLCTLAIRVFTAQDGQKKLLTGWFDGRQYLPTTS